MLDLIRDWIVDRGLDLSLADLISRAFIIVLIFIVSLIVYLLAKYFILKGVAAIVSKTETQWDDMILKRKVF